MRILVADDEKPLADALTQILKKEKYTVDTVYNGEDAFDYLLSDIYDVVLLDIMMPKKDGLTVIREARKEGLKVPIILLTAKSAVEDRVSGLDSGADDYLPKPFATEEMLARVRAVSRRKDHLIVESVITFGDIQLDKDRLLLRKEEKEIKLTLKENELLVYLLDRQNLITPKEMIIEKLWGYDSEAEHNNVEVYISFLRKKLAYLKANVLIVTTRGVGYSIEVNHHV